MKKDLKKIIKTKKPIGKNLSSIIEEKVKPNKLPNIVQNQEEIPVSDSSLNADNIQEKIVTPSQTDDEKNGYFRKLEETIKNIITHNKNVFHYTTNNSTTNKNISNVSEFNNKFKNSTNDSNIENNFKSMFYDNKTISENKASNLAKSSFIKKYLGDVLAINKSKNYIISPVNLPFIENKEKNIRDHVETPSKEKNDHRSYITNKIENFYNPAKKIEVKRPSRIKFPDVIDKSTTFRDSEKELTERVKETLHNNAEVKIFTSRGDARIPTKKLIEHISTKQNDTIPALRDGGLVNSPTLALLGESGPEMVKPLSNITQGIESSRYGSVNVSPPTQGILKNANETLGESAVLRINERTIESLSRVTKMNSETETSLNLGNLQTPSVPQQTAPEGSGAGGDAGASPFTTFFRFKSFSLPEWRTRLS